MESSFHAILHIFNSIFNENEIQNPQIFQQTISLFSRGMYFSNQLLICTYMYVWNFMTNNLMKVNTGDSI
jgi:hypothetical protein